MRMFLLIVMTSFSIGIITGEAPKAYRGIGLGMGQGEVEILLEDDPYFLYKSGTVTSLRENPVRDLIECEGSEFIERAFFHFSEGALVLFTLELNNSKIDYYTLLNDFTEKWGDPDDFSRTESVWKADSHQVVLVRPLSIRYIDTQFLSSLEGDSEQEKNYFEIRREKFLEDF